MIVTLIMLVLTAIVAGMHWKAGKGISPLVSILHIIGTIVVQAPFAFIYAAAKFGSTPTSDQFIPVYVGGGAVALAISAFIARMRNRRNDRQAEQMVDNAAYIDAEVRRRSDQYYQGQ